MARTPASSPAFSRLAGAMVTIGGLVVFAAWIFGIESLKRPAGSAASMKANTALLFIASGSVLWLIASGRGRRWAMLCAALAVAVSLATVSQDVFGWNLAIDELILDAGPAIGHEAPGRMSPITAASFFLLGTALLWPSHWRAWFPQSLALIVGGISSSTLLGYLYEAQQLRALGPTTSVANHTAVLMLVLSAGVFLLRATDGIAGVLRDDSSVGRVFRRAVPVGLLIPVAVGWLERQGQMRGWYSSGLGEVLDALTTAVLLAVVAWVSARMLHRADAGRREAEAALQRANEALEARVAEQTADVQRSEQEAAASAALFSHLFSQAPDAIVCVNPDRTIARFNAKAEELSGYRADEVIGQPAEILLAEPLREAFRSEWPAYLAMTGSVSIEAIGRRKSGEEFSTDVMFSHTDSPGGSLVVAVVRDVSTRRQMETALRLAGERLQASQRLEAIGRLAGGAAHDFNNMMTIVTGYSELLLTRMTDDDPHRRAVREIQRAGVRGAALTRQLLAFSRRQVLSPAVIDLNALVGELCQMLPILLGDGVEVKHVPGADLWHVRVDAAQLEQAIINIAINARDAMPDGGTLTIATANVAILDQAVSGSGEVPPGAYVQLSLIDVGAGMDEATRARAFEPFFTTKPMGKGTGLGLSSVYGVVKQSEGHIELESAPGAGTTVRIYLPRVAAPLSVTPEPPALLAGAASGTVLLVEDDEAVRTLLSQVLAGAGYQVLEADGAFDALRLCESRAEPVHLVVSDVIMPGMSGLDLAERLRHGRHRPRVLLVSGEAPGHGSDARAEGAAFLAKPFTPAELLQRVHDVLAQDVRNTTHA